jgi:hypothetical protein
MNDDSLGSGLVRSISGACGVSGRRARLALASLFIFLLEKRLFLSYMALVQSTEAAARSQGARRQRRPRSSSLGVEGGGDAGSSSPSSPAFSSVLAPKSRRRTRRSPGPRGAVRAAPPQIVTDGYSEDPTKEEEPIRASHMASHRASHRAILRAHELKSRAPPGPVSEGATSALASISSSEPETETETETKTETETENETEPETETETVTHAQIQDAGIRGKKDAKEEGGIEAEPSQIESVPVSDSGSTDDRYGSDAGGFGIGRAGGRWWDGEGDEAGDEEDMSEEDRGDEEEEDGDQPTFGADGAAGGGDAGIESPQGESGGAAGGGGAGIESPQGESGGWGADAGPSEKRSWPTVRERNPSPAGEAGAGAQSEEAGGVGGGAAHDSDVRIARNNTGEDADKPASKSEEADEVVVPSAASGPSHGTMPPEDWLRATVQTDQEAMVSQSRAPPSRYPSDAQARAAADILATQTRADFVRSGAAAAAQLFVERAPSTVFNAACLRVLSTMIALIARSADGSPSIRRSVGADDVTILTEDADGLLPDYGAGAPQPARRRLPPPSTFGVILRSPQGPNTAQAPIGPGFARYLTDKEFADSLAAAKAGPSKLAVARLTGVFRREHPLPSQLYLPFVVAVSDEARTNGDSKGKDESPADLYARVSFRRTAAAPPASTAGVPYAFEVKLFGGLPPIFSLADFTAGMARPNAGEPTTAPLLHGGLARMDELRTRAAEKFLSASVQEFNRMSFSALRLLCERLVTLSHSPHGYVAAVLWYNLSLSSSDDATPDSAAGGRLKAEDATREPRSLSMCGGRAYGIGDGPRYLGRGASTEVGGAPRDLTRDLTEIEFVGALDRMASRAGAQMHFHFSSRSNVLPLHAVLGPDGELLFYQALVIRGALPDSGGDFFVELLVTPLFRAAEADPVMGYTYSARANVYSGDTLLISSGQLEKLMAAR